MPVKIGSTDITAIYHGSTLIADLFSGSTNVGIGGSGPPSPPTTDPYWQETVLLLQDSFVDQSSFGRTLTVNGGAAIDTADTKFGSGSMEFAADPDSVYATVDSSLALTGDFTIECWIKTTQTAGSGRRIVQHRNSATSAANATFFELQNNGSDIRLRYDAYIATTSNAGVNDGNWHHIAGVRNSTHLLVFIDGVRLAEVAVPSSYTISPIGQTLSIAKDNKYSSNGYVGNIDDLRITNGVARYPYAGFTPPTAAFPTAEPVDEFFSDTVLLIQEDLADDSLQGQTVTASGSAALSTTAKVGNYGIAVNGSGNNLVVSTTGHDYGTQDWTWECWMYLPAYSASGVYGLWRAVNHVNGYKRPSIALVSGSLKMSYYNLGGTQTLDSGSLSWNAQQWYHLAVVKHGNTFTFYRDGVSVANNVGGFGTGDTWETDPAGYIINSTGSVIFDSYRLTVGTARYTAAFTPSDQPLPRSNGDPDFADVELLLQDAFTDQSLSGQTITALNTQLSTTTKKIGTHSLQFNGTNAYANTAANTLAFGTGPFTVEFWLYWDGTVTGTPWIGVLGSHNGSFSGGAGDRYGIFIQASTGYITHYIRTAFPTPVPFSANTWTHIASTRDSSGVCRFFIDGVLQTSMTATDAGSLTAGSGFGIGQDANPGRPRLSGFVDELRVTVGTCRYTSNFTPSTTEFPN